MAQATFIAYQPQEHIAFTGGAIIVPEMFWSQAEIRPYEVQHII